MKILKFTDLISWQESHKLVLMIYEATTSFPKFEMFGIVSQMRRSAVSVTSNIAEGFGRRSIREKIQFYFIAQSSLTELQNQLLVSRDVGYTSSETHQEIYKQSHSAFMLICGLIRKSRLLVK